MIHLMFRWFTSDLVLPGFACVKHQKPFICPENMFNPKKIGFKSLYVPSSSSIKKEKNRN